MPIPTPEEMQFLLGVHPEQVMANQTLSAAANGGAQPESGDVPPPDAAPPRPRPISATSAAPGDNTEPVEIAPKPSLIPRPGPRALAVPPVGSPAPDDGTVIGGSSSAVVSGVDAKGRPMLAPAGPEGLTTAAAAPPAPPPTPTNIGSLMTTPIRPISGDQARENTDRAEYQRKLDTGSGVDQFMHRHRFLGPLVKGLSIAGSIISPGAAAAIPGTDLHHQVLLNQDRGRIADDIGDEKAHSRMANSEEAQASRNEATRVREEGMQDKINQTNAKFVAGSEREDPNSPTGWTATTIGGEAKPYTPPQSYKQTKGEASADEMTARGKQADKLKLVGDDRKFYIANGKLREPNPNQAQIDEDRKARLQRQSEHDQDARTQHYQNDHARWAEHKSAIEKDQEQGYVKAENDWRKKYGDESNNDITGLKDTDPKKQAAIAERDANKKLVEDSAQARFKELGPEPQQPQLQAAPVEGRPEADTSEIPQPIASVRAPGPAPIGGPVQTPVATEKTAKPSPVTQQQPKPGDVVGPAPTGSTEGRTGKLADGTKVVVKGGRLVAQ